jgi:hypothetical protein
MGIEKSREEAAALVASAKSALPDGDPGGAALLRAMFDFLVERIA